MSLLDDLKNTVFGNFKDQAANAAEDMVTKVTDMIPGELDDKLAADVVQSVEENLGIDTSDNKEAAN